MSRVGESLSWEFPSRSDTKLAVQPQMMVIEA